MKEDFQTLEDLFMDWFYHNKRTWKTLPEFLEHNHYGNALSPRDLSDLMLGNAAFPSQYVLLLLKKTPYKLTEEEIISLNRQSKIKNRFARIIEIDKQNLETLRAYIKNPRARKYFSEQERKDAKNALKREKRRQTAKKKKEETLAAILQNIYAHKIQYGEKIEHKELPPKPKKEYVWKPVSERRPISPPNPLSKHMLEGRPKRVGMLVPLLECIRNHKLTHGEEIKPIELTNEAAEKRKKREKRRQDYLKTLEPDYIPQKRIIYSTEEERKAAKRASRIRFEERRLQALGRKKQIPLTEEEKKASRKAAQQKYEAKLSKKRAANILMPMIYGIQNKLVQNGKIEPLELTAEIIEKRKKKQRYQELKKLKQNPDYVYERPKKYKSEEERIAAYKELYKKSNSSEKHAEWVKQNTDKVAEYKRNWRKNNPERAREVKIAYKKRKKVKSIIALLRGIVEYNEKQTLLPQMPNNTPLNNKQQEY